MYECLVDATGWPLQFTEAGTSILKIPADPRHLRHGSGPVQELAYAIHPRAGVKMGSYHASIPSVLTAGH